jgi:hypothetical protein
MSATSASAREAQVVAAGRRVMPREPRLLAGVDRPQVQLLVAEPHDRPALGDLPPHAEHAPVPLGGRLEVGDVEDQVVDALDGEGHTRSLAG